MRDSFGSRLQEWAASSNKKAQLEPLKAKDSPRMRTVAPATRVKVEVIPRGQQETPTTTVEQEAPQRRKLGALSRIALACFGLAAIALGLLILIPVAALAFGAISSLFK